MAAHCRDSGAGCRVGGVGSDLSGQVAEVVLMGGARFLFGKVCLSLFLIMGFIGCDQALAETVVTIAGQRVAAKDDIVYYTVMITGISGEGTASLRFGSPLGGVIRGDPQTIPADTENWTGLFPIQFGNVTTYPIEVMIHATFTEASDGRKVDSGVFYVTVLPLGWPAPIQKGD